MPASGGGQVPQVHVELGPEIKRVADALRQIDAKAPGEMRRSMRRAAADGMKRVKRNVRGLDVSGEHGSTGLRREVATGVKLKVSAGGRRGAGLRVTTTMRRSKAAVIPRGLDSFTKYVGWTHPVFQRAGLSSEQAVRVTQPGYSWFMEAWQEERPKIQAEMQAIVDDAKARLRAAGVDGY
jgi:hypothetical protein